MSTHSHVGTDWLGERACPVCGNNFSVLYPDLWRYKYNSGKKIFFYCSYSCKREAEKERDEMKKLTLEQKKKAVQIAVDGGNPLGFLEDLGIKNSAEAWSKIKAHLKEFDPDTYAQLPKRLPQREQKAEAPKVVLVEDPSIAEEYRAEQAEKRKITRAKRDGFKVTAIENTLGEFYFDRKHNKLDWRAPGGEEVSMDPKCWFDLYMAIPDVMGILGVEDEHD